MIHKRENDKITCTCTRAVTVYVHVYCILLHVHVQGQHTLYMYIMLCQFFSINTGHRYVIIIIPRPRIACKRDTVVVVSVS